MLPWYILLSGTILLAAMALVGVAGKAAPDTAGSLLVGWLLAV